MRIQAVVFDTTYFLPSFGVEVDVDSTENIRRAIRRFVSKGGSIVVSFMTPLEALLKACRIAEKQESSIGFLKARVGFEAMVSDPIVKIVGYSDIAVLEEAVSIRRAHRDPFDCFIFATARAKSLPLLTEDEEAQQYVSHVISWEEFKSKLLS